jgi:hypothetical protein
MRGSSLVAVALAWIVSPPVFPQQPVNPDAAILEDFKKHVADYVKLHKQVASEIARLKPTTAPEKIVKHEDTLAEKIRDARKDAKQGDIFTPPVEAEFRRLIAITMSGPRAARIRKSLKSAEPVQLHIKVNEEYPKSIPLQSTPSTLLLNLPELPKEVDYRIVGRSLILRDVDANIVVDFIANAIS